MAENSRGTGAPSTHHTTYEHKMRARDVEIATGGRSREDTMKETRKRENTNALTEPDIAMGSHEEEGIRASAAPEPGSSLHSDQTGPVRDTFDSAVIIGLALLMARIGMAVRRPLPETVARLLNAHVARDDPTALLTWRWLRSHGLVQQTKNGEVAFERGFYARANDVSERESGSDLQGGVKSEFRPFSKSEDTTYE